MMREVDFCRFLSRNFTIFPVPVLRPSINFPTIHNSDFAKGFVGLLGNPVAVGEAFHITSDEALTWDQIHQIIASKIGATAEIIHMPADFICEQYPEFTGPLKGDKIHTALFDNSKIKCMVPGFICRTPFHIGIEDSLRRLETHPEENQVNADLDKKLDELIRRSL